MALRDAPPPSAVSLRAPAERSEADAAAATIQSAYRGRGGGKAGAAGASEAAAADGPGALRVDVRSLSLPEALRGGESVESVWVEVELLELDPGAARLKTGAVQCRGGQCDVNFSHSLPLTDGSAAAESLGKALRSEDEQALALLRLHETCSQHSVLQRACLNM